jgi:hypothetical protein
VWMIWGGWRGSSRTGRDTRLILEVAVVVRGCLCACLLEIDFRSMGLEVYVGGREEGVAGGGQGGTGHVRESVCVFARGAWLSPLIYIENCALMS